MTSNTRFHEQDPCYGLHYILEGDPFDPQVAGPISAPGRILAEVLRIANEATSGDQDFHPAGYNVMTQEGSQAHTLVYDYELGPCLRAKGVNGESVYRPITRLEHALGTWHLAEHILKFGRVKILERRRESDASEIPLAARMIYGNRVGETIREEFSLASFFHAYLGSDPTVASVTDYLNPDSNAAFREYQSQREGPRPINTNMISYWIAHEPELTNEAMERLLDDFEIIRKYGGNIPDIERIKRIRSIFFKDNGPLNLRHLDLIGRVYSKYHGNNRFSRILHKFLGRIVVMRQQDGDLHLLPKRPPWDNYSPYYIPDRNDDPIYEFIDAYRDGLRRIIDGGRKVRGSKFSLWKACDTADEKDGSRVGLLRLSLVDFSRTDASARVYSKRLNRVTKALADKHAIE